jgi:hypothetical protein
VLDFGSAAKTTPSVFHESWASDVEKFARSKLGQLKAARRARATDGARLKSPGRTFSTTCQVLENVSQTPAQAYKVAAAMSDSEDNVETQTFRRLERLRELRIEHRDLDDVINRLQLDLYVNEVQLRRLKKRKLMLKDQIARLESELIPDLNA